MLALATHTPRLGVPNRRAFHAASLLLQLAGFTCDVLAKHFSQEPKRYIALDEAGLAILPTTCDRPLLLEAAAALAQECDFALILRLSTDLDPRAGLLSVDVVSQLDGWQEVVMGLRPCLSTDIFPLSLARVGSSAPVFLLTRNGLRRAGFPAPSGWNAAAGIAAAEARLRANIWGGM